MSLLMTLAGPSNEGSSLLSGLQAYWKLDEASNTRADSGPNGFTLNDFNTVTQGVGIQGNAAQFTSANSEYLYNSSPSINPPATGSYAISCWVNLDSNVAGFGILGRYNTIPTSSYVLIFASGSGKFFFYTHSTTPAQFNVATALAYSTVGQWYHIVCQRDYPNSQISITINNGTPAVAAMSNSAPNQAGTTNFRVGQSNGTDYMNGRIDEVGIWDRLLTAAEITALYNGGAGKTYPF